METKHFNINANQCVGCENCVHICPTRSIKFSSDKEGFGIPIYDETSCISCGKCLSVCQVNTVYCNDNNPLASMAAISKNKFYYNNGASGGLFGTIANQVLKTGNNWAVCGATFFDGLVKHVLVNRIEDIPKLQNSRYVQSTLGDLFVTIKEKIKKGSNILFCGTPCQVYALKLFIGESSQLFTIDLICHGVPSPLLLKHDLSQYGKNISDVKFRLKKKHGISLSSFVLSIRHERYTEHILSNRDAFFNTFISCDTFRESCYNCKFTNVHRVGDITLGDCDSHNELRDFHLGESINTVLINSPKGQYLWGIVKSEIDYCDLDLKTESTYNTQLAYPSKRNSIRDVIYSVLLKTNPIDKEKKFSKRRDIKEKLILLKMGYWR